VLRKLRYETGALISFVKPYMERYTGILEGLMENPPEETPGWHSSELETSQDMAWNPDLVRMERAVDTRAHIPEFLPKAFSKNDGMPDAEFEGYQYFSFPMDHHEFVENGIIGKPDARDRGEGRGSLPSPERARCTRPARVGEGSRNRSPQGVYRAHNVV